MDESPKSNQEDCPHAYQQAIFNTERDLVGYKCPQCGKVFPPPPSQTKLNKTLSQPGLSPLQNPLALLQTVR